MRLLCAYQIDFRKHKAMPTGHISKRSVDAFQSAAKDTYLWDDELAGFGLKVTPARRKVYLVQYRLGGRKGRVHPGVTAYPAMPSLHSSGGSPGNRSRGAQKGD